MSDDRRRPQPDAPLSLSRRSFLRAAMGSIVVLPSVAGGFLIPFAGESEGGVAYAADEKAGPTSLKVTIARADQCAIVVRNMEDKKELVKGAKVTVTSTENKKAQTLTTDGDGKCFVDLAQLCKAIDQDGVKVYRVYCEIDVEAQGYRMFRTLYTQLESGKAFQLPTRRRGSAESPRRLCRA